MRETNELLPCPFCGGEAETFNPFDAIPGTWCVICRECASCNGFEQTEPEAIEAWNTRVDEKPSDTCSSIDYMLNTIGEREEHVAELERENEQLRQQLNQYLKLLLQH